MYDTDKDSDSLTVQLKTLPYSLSGSGGLGEETTGSNTLRLISRGDSRSLRFAMLVISPSYAKFFSRVALPCLRAFSTFSTHSVTLSVKPEPDIPAISVGLHDGSFISISGS